MKRAKVYVNGVFAGRWDNLINNSFLSENMRSQYKKLITDRWKRLSE